MNADLQRLQQATGQLGPIIERLELELVDDPTWGLPSDTSYLTAADRANPDIAANVDAMKETNKLIAWFGKDAEGFVGVWRGPSDRSLEASPVVRLDTEGQYSIVAATIPEYIAISVPEDEFPKVRAALVGAGFKVGNNPDAIWGALDAFDDDPNAYRNELYEQNREKRGLARSDAPEDEEPEPEPVPKPIAKVDSKRMKAAVPQPIAKVDSKRMKAAVPQPIAKADSRPVKTAVPQPVAKADSKPVKAPPPKAETKPAAAPAKKVAPAKKAAPAKAAPAKKSVPAKAAPAKKAKPAAKAKKKR